MRELYQSTLTELEAANQIKTDSRNLLATLEENFSLASKQYDSTLEVSAGSMSFLHQQVWSQPAMLALS